MLGGRRRRGRDWGSQCRSERRRRWGRRGSEHERVVVGRLGGGGRPPALDPGGHMGVSLLLTPEKITDGTTSEVPFRGPMWTFHILCKVGPTMGVRKETLLRGRRENFDPNISNTGKHRNTRNTGWIGGPSQEGGGHLPLNSGAIWITDFWPGTLRQAKKTFFLGIG